MRRTTHRGEEDPGQAATPSDETPRPDHNGDFLFFGPYHFDPGFGQLYQNGAEIPLPPRSVDLLAHLLDHGGKVVSKDALIEAGWGRAYVSDASLSEAVNRIRGALGDDFKAQQYIQTVHGRGYKFVCPVTVGNGEEATIEAPAAAQSASASQALPAARQPRLLYGIFGIFAAILAVGLVFRLTTSRPASPQWLTTELVAAGAQRQGPDGFSTLSPDGTRIAYAKDGQVWVWDLVRGDEAQLTGRGQEASDFSSPWGIFRWSADSRRIAYEWNDDSVSPRQLQVRIIPATGGEPEVVFRPTPGAGRAIVRSWSPDGDVLLVALLVSDLDAAEFVLAELMLDDGSIRVLSDTSVISRNALTNNNGLLEASYAPGGDRIAYSTREDGKTVVYVMTRDGSRRVQVPNVSTIDNYPLWSPDGRVLLITRNDGGSTELVAIELEGLRQVGDPLSLRLNVTGRVVPRTWTPNGQLLYGDAASDTTIFRLPMDSASGEATGDAASFTELLGGLIGLRFVPAHDGQAVIVGAAGRRSVEPYVLRRDGFQALSWPNDFTGGLSLVGWAPDDSWVLLGGLHAERQLGFHRVFLDSGMVEEAVEIADSELHNNFAVLSPQGTRVALERGTEITTTRDMRMAVLDLTSGELTELPVSGTFLKSGWSPDGQRLAVARVLDRGYDLLIVPIDGAPPTTLAEFAPDGRLSAPTWSPDGRYIAYRYSEEDVQEIQVIAADGGQPRVVFAGDPRAGHMSTIHWSADGSGIYFHRGRGEDRVFIARNFIDTSGDEIRVASALPSPPRN